MLTIVAIIVIAIAAVLAFAATRPDSFRIERSVVIDAPPERVFPLVNDFHQWEAWSPWEGIDPQLKRTYAGPSSGVGAVYEWDGNRNIGHGRMEIVESQPSSKLVIDLHFITPFEARNKVDFVLEPQGAGTRVTQAMYGPSPFVSKLMSLVFSMEKMVGGKYEQGLASLKTLAEKQG